MGKRSEQTRVLSKSIAKWACAAALTFTLLYAAAAVVFDRYVSPVIGDAVAQVVAPWEEPSAFSLDLENDEEYQKRIKETEADVVRVYLSRIANLYIPDYGQALYASVDEAQAADGSPADRVLELTLDEVNALAAEAPDVLSEAASHIASAFLDAYGYVEHERYAAASVALARSEGFFQAREQGRTLSADVVFDGYLPSTQRMRDIVLLAVDLRNAGVAGNVYDGIWRLTAELYANDDELDELLADVKEVDGVDLSTYAMYRKSADDGLAEYAYYADGHVMMRDLHVYDKIRFLKIPVAVLGYLAGLLVIAVLATRKSLGYFDQFLAAVGHVAQGTSDADELPEVLSDAQRTLDAVRQREEVARHEARLAERGKDELVAYLAHDTKTPPTSVIGYLTILAEAPDAPVEQRRRYAQTALDKSYWLDGMIDEFFEIARFGISTLEIERALCDPAVLCSQVADELFPAAEARNVTICVSAEEGERAFVDAGKLSRALSNVMKNAASYADAGSTVEVRLTWDDAAKSGAFAAAGAPDAPDAPATSAAPAAQRRFRIEVENRGREISPGHLERIFEKFYREDAARASDKGGAGLGLAIAREIMRAHGGDITAESAHGKTTFTLVVPAGDDAPAVCDNARAADGELESAPAPRSAAEQE